MKTYKVTITEYSKCVVEVEADSIEEARERVENKYWEHPNNYLLEPYDTKFE